MREYIRKWDFMRALRLAMGVFITLQGFWTGQWLFVMAGLAFSLMPILNIGCCGTSRCGAPMHRGNQKIEDVTYEEVS